MSLTATVPGMYVSSIKGSGTNQSVGCNKLRTLHQWQELQRVADEGTGSETGTVVR